MLRVPDLGDSPGRRRRRMLASLISPTTEFAMEDLVLLEQQSSGGIANGRTFSRRADENALPARRLCTTIVVGLSLVYLGFSFWATTVGWNNTIFDNHGFRQSQTAISTFYF